MRVLNLGAGVQSTTVYLMGVRGELHVDCAVFADTQEEPAAVYRHLEWLRSLNGPPIHVVSRGRLGDDLVKGQNTAGRRFATIPAFTYAAGKRGQVRRQCTSEYKIRPIEQFIRRQLFGLRPKQRLPRGVTVVQMYGISADEASRARRIQERMARTPALKPEFPLLERGMTRADCLRWLAAFGVPHTVSRSACVFCPYKSNAEWARLKAEDAEGWRRAVEIDEALRQEGAAARRGLEGTLYLHPSCQPLAQIDFASAGDRPLGFAVECSGMCGV